MKSTHIIGRLTIVATLAMAVSAHAQLLGGGGQGGSIGGAIGGPIGATGHSAGTIGGMSNSLTGMASGNVAVGASGQSNVNGDFSARAQTAATADNARHLASRGAAFGRESANVAKQAVTSLQIGSAQGSNAVNIAGQAAISGDASGQSSANAANKQ